MFEIGLSMQSSYNTIIIFWNGNHILIRAFFVMTEFDMIFSKISDPNFKVPQFPQFWTSDCLLLHEIHNYICFGSNPSTFRSDFSVCWWIIFLVLSAVMEGNKATTSFPRWWAPPPPLLAAVHALSSSSSMPTFLNANFKCYRDGNGF